MKSSHFIETVRQEFTRAMVFSFFFVLLSGLALYGFSLYAASPDGGAFGRAINLILTGNADGVTGKDWSTPGDGTVQNALKLDGSGASDYQRTNTTQPPCPSGQAIISIDADGTWHCGI